MSARLDATMTLDPYQETEYAQQKRCSLPKVDSTCNTTSEPERYITCLLARTIAQKHSEETCSNAPPEGQRFVQSQREDYDPKECHKRAFRANNIISLPTTSKTVIPVQA